MRKRVLRGMFAAAAIGAASAVVGCGGVEEGTTVEVDKEAEKQLTESMESYYEKNEPR